MLLAGKIVSKETKAPVPYASITVIDKTGKATGAGTMADAGGSFLISSDQIAAPNQVLFSSGGGGFAPLIIDASIFNGSSVQIELEEKSDLPPVVITFKPNKNFWFLFLVGIGIFAIAKKKNF